MRELLSRALAGLAAVMTMVAATAWVALGLIGSAEAAGTTAVALLSTPAAGARVVSLLSEYTDAPVADEMAAQVHDAASRSLQDPAVVEAARTAAGQIWTAQFVTGEPVVVDLTAVLTAVHNQLGDSVPVLTGATQTTRFSPVARFSGPEPINRLRQARTFGAIGALAAFTASIVIARGTWSRRIRRGGVSLTMAGVGLWITTWMTGRVGVGIGTLVADRLRPVAIGLTVAGVALIAVSIVVAVFARASARPEPRTSRDATPPSRPTPQPAPRVTSQPAPGAASRGGQAPRDGSVGTPTGAGVGVATPAPCPRRGTPSTDAPPGPSRWPAPDGSRRIIRP